MEKTGQVKWFNDTKGYGFIKSSTGEDVFVHRSAIIEDGLQILKEGDAVMFNVVNGQKWLQAADVWPLSWLLVPHGKLLANTGFVQLVLKLDKSSGGLIPVFDIRGAKRYEALSLQTHYMTMSASHLLIRFTRKSESPFNIILANGDCVSREEFEVLLSKVPMWILNYLEKKGALERGRSSCFLDWSDIPIEYHSAG